jgi:dihydroxyacetone kinase
MMALGLGIHGEPGIREEATVSASELAALLADRLLAERPSGITRVAALLNGLGSTKYEELFVLWASVSQRLKDAGLEIVAPEAGEYVTSLDMQGCSLSLMWLDAELETYWTAACDTPVLKRGGEIRTEPATDIIVNEDAAPVYIRANEAGRKAAACIAGLVGRVAHALRDAEEELGRIDAQAGDGDHGQGMRRGSAAAREAADHAVAAGAGAASTLAAAADAWADRAGGTSGAIWGLLLRSWSTALSDDGAIDEAAVVKGARTALGGVTRLGRARVGDKTLVDALVPFVETLEAAFASGKPLRGAWAEAASASQAAADATARLTPKLGRARPIAERSIGHPDAGAISLALVARVAGQAF